MSMDSVYSTLSKEKLLKLLEEKDGEILNLKKNVSTKFTLEESITVIDNEKDEVFPRQIDACHLSNNEISRYSRQLILPELGVKNQLKLKNSSVLIVGGGGLGCPASLYLAAAGIGRIGVIDYDEVELSNLHRQVSHTQDRIGRSKALSITQSCQSLNSSVEYVPYHMQINSSNALEIIKRYDIILDATDNVATRYLLNDACVLAGKPLVSGSALRFEGQLTVYNHDGGPCYRCLFPQPPPPETVTNCSDGGVVGVVPGIIGSLQALEAIKIATGIGLSYRQRLLLFDAMDGTFRNIKLRPRSTGCMVCGDNPTLLQLIDYEQFCGARASDKDKDLHILGDSNRLKPEGYAQMVSHAVPHVLVDVRPGVELDICKLPHSAINIPLSSLKKSPLEAMNKINQQLKTIQKEHENEDIPVVCVCRRGNDSQMAVKLLQDLATTDTVSKCRYVDIRGGLHGWTRKVDPTFPTY